MRGPALVLGFALICGPTAALTREPTSLMDQFMRAWDASDSEAISNLFAPEADLVAPDGSYAKGRSAIASYYAAAFADGYSGSQGVGQTIQQIPITPDLALLDARFTIFGAHKADGSLKGAEKGLLVAVLRRVGGDWRILALRERTGGDFIPLPPPR